jgi:hypothetical protein
MSRRNPCDHCQKEPWTDSWVVTACAAKRRPRTAKLCRDCDATLNALVLRFIGYPNVDEMIREYRCRK